MTNGAGSETRQETSVAAQYDQWAGVYDVFWRRYVNKTLPVAQQVANVEAGERMLDLACGTGALSRRVVQAVPDVEIVGVDLSSNMVDRARKKLDGEAAVQFERADAHNLPFDEDAFDVVVCASTFHYFTHPSVVVGEVARVLRPDGRFVVLDWCRDFWTCRVMDVVLRRLDPAHHDCYTVDEVTSLLKSAGLGVRDQFRYRFDLIWGMMVIDAVCPAPE